MPRIGSKFKTHVAKKILTSIVTLIGILLVIYLLRVLLVDLPSPRLIVR
jgi:hypothetical protein